MGAIEGTPRPAGWDAGTIYRWFHEGKDTGQTIHPASEAWRKLGQRYEAVQQRVEDALRKNQGSWEGQAAEAMATTVSPLAAWAEEAKRVTEGVAGRVDNQGSAFTDTKHKVEPPQQVPDKPFLNDYVPWQTDYDDAVSANKAVTDRNIQAVKSYGTTTRDNIGSLPTFAPPPTVETDLRQSDTQPVEPGYRDHTVDPTRQVTNHTTMDRHTVDPVGPPPLRPADPSPPGGQVISPPPATVDPAFVHPGQPGGTEAIRPPADFGSGRTPGASNPNPLYPVVPPGGPGSARYPGSMVPRPPVRGGLPGFGPNPAGRSGGVAGGLGSGFGPRGSGGFGPGGPGAGGNGPLGPGGGTGTGAPPSGPRPGLPGPEGGTANRGGPGVAGGIGAGAGRKEEDREHQRPHYLLETEDIYGDNRRVAPPVIGEPPPER
ncbi:hypothetical protein GCM10012275_60400 [Longimycelium tulufanense]|uniref:PPE domain-containing protein n=1 Tax=Longimycelium tulufanense TaxID=907463 RepID=A0A8J3CKD2_9PSEU|nr:PPE domain-containing protein [Longimycelium tulufanense]GGM81677.1 hypothetical protein GCM10012275_60400 [Longimycelium tulufanense]